MVAERGQDLGGGDLLHPEREEHVFRVLSTGPGHPHPGCFKKISGEACPQREGVNPRGSPSITRLRSTDALVPVSPGLCTEHSGHQPCEPCLSSHAAAQPAGQTGQSFVGSLRT